MIIFTRIIKTINSLLSVQEKVSGQVGVIETDENLFVVRHPTNLRRVEAATAGTKTAAVAAVPESPELKHGYGTVPNSHVSFETYWRDRSPIWA